MSSSAPASKLSSRISQRIPPPQRIFSPLARNADSVFEIGSLFFQAQISLELVDLLSHLQLQSLYATI
jgi:hypothetical protein